MEFKISLARVTGSDHSLHKIPCQDKTAVFAGDDYTTAALADGAGSRPFSHVGAELATVAVASKLYVRFEDFGNTNRTWSQPVHGSKPPMPC